MGYVAQLNIAKKVHAQNAIQYAKSHTECTNPTPKCESVCEEPLCDWKCHRPADCQKPRCALVCEKSPHCQPQPPKADCCACAKAEVKTEEPKKCCGCDAKKE